MSQVAETAEDDHFEPRWVHIRLAAAYEEAFQDGQNPTDGVIAKKLAVRRETIVRWRRRNPAMRQWLYEQIGMEALDRRPFVDRRVTQLAIQGSAEHMKLFYQFVSKVTPAFEEPGAGRGDIKINLLVPRPDNVDIPGLMAATPPQGPVPTVAVRR